MTEADFRTTKGGVDLNGDGQFGQSFPFPLFSEHSIRYYQALYSTYTVTTFHSGPLGSGSSSAATSVSPNLALPS
jgi:hypothetical protein